MPARSATRWCGPTALRCHCGATGCLETEVTRTELLSVLGLDDEQSVQLEETLAARASEPAVAALVERQLGFLGRALANVVNVLNPELVVLGGFLGPLYAADPGRLEDVVRSIAMTGLRDDVRFVRSELGDDLLAVGAAELSFGPLIADPASIRAGLSQSDATAALTAGASSSCTENPVDSRPTTWKSARIWRGGIFSPFSWIRSNRSWTATSAI